MLPKQKSEKKSKFIKLPELDKKIMKLQKKKSLLQRKKNQYCFQCKAGGSKTPFPFLPAHPIQEEAMNQPSHHCGCMEFTVRPATCPSHSLPQILYLFL